MDASRCNVYFCINLFDIVKQDSNVSDEQMIVNDDNLKSIKVTFNVNKCENCEANKLKAHLTINDRLTVKNKECENHFDYLKFRNLIIMSDPHRVNNEPIYCETQTQNNLNFDFSILDSLEKVGYFGQISFEAVVQRVYKMKINANIIKYDLSLSS